MNFKPSGLSSEAFIQGLRAKVERDKASERELARILGVNVEDIDGDNNGKTPE